MVASHQSPGASPWYIDTGATNHITSDINNLTLRSDYPGSYRVFVENDVGLHISHIGSTSFSVPITYFRLLICYMFPISLPV